jgi:hypothetical protein
MSKPSGVGRGALTILGPGLAVLLSCLSWSIGRGAGPVAADTAVLELDAPAGSEVSIDGQEKGTRRTFTFGPFQPGRYLAHQVRARFPDGGVVERRVLLRGGWHLPLPLREARANSRPELVVQTGHTAEISSVALSPDGKHVLTGSVDHTAAL